MSNCFVPPLEIKRICFIDCENFSKSILTFYEYPLKEDSFVFLFYSGKRERFWDKIPTETKDKFICIQSTTKASNAADAAMIVHIMRLHLRVSSDVIFYICSSDGIFKEIVVQLAIQGTLCELISDANLGYHLYLQKNILLPDTSFEKTLKLIRTSFSLKTQRYSQVFDIIKKFIIQENLSYVYWQPGMIASEILRTTEQKINRKLSPKDSIFLEELESLVEKLQKFIKFTHNKQISFSAISIFLEKDIEFIRKYFGTVNAFLQENNIRIKYRLDGVLVLQK